MKMIYLFMRHRVEDYARWKEVFDSHLPARQAGGATDVVYVMRNVDDCNEITIILGWHDLKTARTFRQSVSLKDALHKAGVINLTAIQFLEAVY
ncbi:MAG: hypothetical protein K8L99_10890 [Anaerolineae bacterium]|nr:hypothetical protein [Anaerolineae bacterium]